MGVPTSVVIDRSTWIPHAEMVAPPPYIACHNARLVPTPAGQREWSKLWKRDEFFRMVGQCMKAAGLEVEEQNMYVQPGQSFC